MDDWLRNMGDWNISRKRYFGLPLPIYPCDCGEVNVIGSRAELDERATSGLDQLQELHRPWIDQVTICCKVCGKDLHRIPEVGDAWLDAGIVPFSTLGWQNSEWISGGYANGAAEGLSGADLPDHAYWEQWFPADWISEMREQIRSGSTRSRSCRSPCSGRPYRRVLTYEKLLDETGREMHRSWGTRSRRTRRSTAWARTSCAGSSASRTRARTSSSATGRQARSSVGCSRFWNSVKFLVDYANVADWSPGDTGEPEPLDLWLGSRVEQFVAEMTDAYERYWTPDLVAFFERFVDDLSNWYIRRSRRRFWNSDPAACRRFGRRLPARLS